MYIVYYSLARLISIVDKRTKEGKRCKKIEREREREENFISLLSRRNQRANKKCKGSIIIQKDKLILLRYLQTNRTIRLIVS